MMIGDICKCSCHYFLIEPFIGTASLFDILYRKRRAEKKNPSLETELIVELKKEKITLQSTN
jgi:hypothetical protein